MKKILLLPFMPIASGHIQVAKTMKELLKSYEEDVEVVQVDLLTEVNKTIANLMSKSYLSWIHYFPKSYDKFYSKKFNNEHKKSNSIFIEKLMKKRMLQLIQIEQPDLVICTHGYPSHLLNELKESFLTSVPVMNVYTDFFKNSVWGTSMIDFHIVPHAEFKEQLVEQGVADYKVLVSGIPVHPSFHSRKTKRPHSSQLNILISGGNSGVGNLKQLVMSLRYETNHHYYVLCGKNKPLYSFIENLRLPHVVGLPYIDSSEKMNALYNEMDAVITKPGGITVSELLKKQIPIFVHASLPGQEKVNLQFLRQKGLIFELKKEFSIEKQIENVLFHPKKMALFELHLRQFMAHIDVQSEAHVMTVVHSLIENYNRSDVQARRPKVHMQLSSI